jgi:hypothetical protein
MTLLHLIATCKGIGWNQNRAVGLAPKDLERTKMPKEQKRERSSATSTQFPGAGKLMQGQNFAVRNATRMTGQVCHQAMSMNRAWFTFWSTLIMDFATLPRRLTSAQVDYIDDMLSSFEETGREVGNLVLHAEEEAEETVKKNVEEARRSMREQVEETKQAAGALQSTANSRRQKNEGGKGRRTEQGSHSRAH